MSDALTSGSLIPTRPVRKAQVPQQAVNTRYRRPKVPEFAASIPGWTNGELRLTKNQKLFLEYYLQGCNLKEAALKAGYSPNTAVGATQAILDSEAVQKVLTERARQQFRRLEMTTNRILHETAKIAFSNILDYIKVNAKGDFEIDLTAVNRDLGAAIQELSYDSNGRPKIRLADKRSSLELLGRFMKMLNPEKSPDSEEKPLTIQALDQLIQKQMVQNVTINQTVVMAPERQQLPAPTTIEAQ